MRENTIFIVLNFDSSTSAPLDNEVIKEKIQKHLISGNIDKMAVYVLAAISRRIPLESIECKYAFAYLQERGFSLEVNTKTGDLAFSRPTNENENPGVIHYSW